MARRRSIRVAGHEGVGGEDWTHKKVSTSPWTEEYVRRGSLYLPVGGIIYWALKNAITMEAWVSEAPKIFINHVESAETASLNVLRKQKWWTKDEFEKTMALIQQYHVDPTMGGLSPAVRMAKAKLRRLYTLMEPYMDAQNLEEYDVGSVPEMPDAPEVDL